ncbi:hypothetical protein H0I23_14295 [Cellulophaga sp. HaHaR_3_176]|uniref:hypothetical protein n=1 Tax=Cellulophaga sp. HaHaR_3_176 TaxID=1942464 RepID=UPI001C1FA616|nr:hypothetical protein [Cellulophaga sp. HaHaR_3_176]QWX83609.1 hypothetical protein H0I23_14295 [Cellulophaga sp. HaHaR_3_176]
MSMKEVILSIGVFFILLVLFISNRNHTQIKKIQDKNKNRPKISKQKYIQRLVEKGFEEDHIEVFYNEIKRIIGIDNFPIYPEDDIYENYGLWDLDDIDLIDNICVKLKVRKAEQKDFNELGKTFNKMNAESILTLIKTLKKNT